MVYSKNVLQSSVPDKKTLQQGALQNLVMEIGRDWQSEAERNHRQRPLGGHLNGLPANAGRLHNGRLQSGQRGQGFAPTRKFYQSRRK